MSTEIDNRLATIRRLANSARNGHPINVAHLANEILTLDSMLSAGAIPPEAWREGPDAPEVDGATWGWQGDPRADLDDEDPRPVPEGLAVFAHWSASHDGINVEMDVPDGLRVTVHFNEWLAVDATAGVNGNRGELIDDDGSHIVACQCEQCTEDD